MLTAPLFLQRCGSCPSQCRPSIVHQLQRWPIPGKHRRELWIRLFRPLHRMSNRKKKSTHHSPMTERLLSDSIIVMSADLNNPRGSLRVTSRQHTPHQAVFRAPRGGGPPFVAPLVLLLVPRLPVRSCRLAASPPHHPCAVLPSSRLVACRYGPSGGATSGDADSGQCIIW